MRSLISYGFLAPPAVFIALSLFGALIALVWQRTGLAIVVPASLCIFVTATPAFSSYLTQLLEAQIPDDTELAKAQAIVVLGADVRAGRNAMSDRLGPASVERLVFATAAYRQLRLPIAVSGGRVADWHTTVAQLMKSMLEAYFDTPVAWSEDQSRTTYENALYTARLLRDQHIGTVVLVTQAEDLPRAIWSFEHVGMRAIPWSSPRTRLSVDDLEDFLPNANAFQHSFHALHEIIGGLYYRLVY